jgi:hypothetical protein
VTYRIVAIVFIFLCTAAAWGILGSTIFARTYSARSGLRGKVESTWGASQQQAPPSATYILALPADTRRGGAAQDAPQKKQPAPLPASLTLETSNIEVHIYLEPRQKGLLWYSTYRVSFDGSYAFRNSGPAPGPVTFNLKFPAAQAVYDDLVFTVNSAGVPLTTGNGGVSAAATLPPDGVAVVRVAYRSQGLDSWQYNLGGEGVARVRDFNLKIRTNFSGIDFPENTLSPTFKSRTGDGWDLAWNYKDLVSGFPIALKMPEKLQPGPLAGEISLFAPVSLFFFFFLLFMISVLRGIDLHPMNYFFLAAAFFSFHLLLAYLVDHISIHVAFLICSVVSMFLVITYLRLVVGLRFAAVEAGLSQFVYQVLFSYAFFYQGFTGLTVTIGSIVTLFVVMQLTGRIRWSERLQKASAQA